jgi:hypothetical protein
MVTDMDVNDRDWTGWFGALTRQERADLLGSHGIEAQTSSVAGTSLEMIKNRTPDAPQWLNTLRRVFAASPSKPAGHGAMVDKGLSLLVDPLEPLIDHTRERLLRGVRRLRQKHACAPFDEHHVAPMLEDMLVERLARMIARTLTLELHVAR